MPQLSTGINYDHSCINAHAELIKDVDLREIVKQVFNATELSASCLQDHMGLMARIIERDNWESIGARAAVSTVVEFAELLFTNVSTFSTGEGISNAIVGIVFCSIDLYRWSKGEISDTYLGFRLTEHTLGCAAAYGGAMVGGVLAVALGAASGGALALVGVILGGFIGDFVARYIVRWSYNKYISMSAEERLKEYTAMVANAGLICNVNIQEHTLNEANSRYRKKTILCHPDKFVNESPEVRIQKEEEFKDLFAAWQILRQYYADHPGINDDGDVTEEYHEGFVEVWVLHVRETVDGAWNFVRAFYEDAIHDIQDPQNHTDLRRIEKIVMYV
jgi:hypothetical protein